MRFGRFGIVVLALAIAAGVAYGYRGTLWPATTAAVTPGAPPAGGGRPPVTVEAAEAQLKPLTDGISAIGSLVAADSADVSADSAGRLVAIMAENAATVKRGDELFRLDGALLAAELADAEARFSLAEATFRRSQTLARSQTVAQSTVDQTRAELEQARSAMELVRERQRRLSVRAPFDGQLDFAWYLREAM